MTDFHDPDELLRAANPINEDQVPSASESPHAHLLFKKITGTEYHRAGQPSRRWSTRTRVGLAALVIALTGTGGSIAYAVATSEPTKNLNTVCYATPDRAANETVVNTTGQGALRDCAAAWTSGDIPGQPPEIPPPLIACVIVSGEAGVFPNSGNDPDLCRKLGLHAINPQPPQPVTTTTITPTSPTGHARSPSTPATTAPAVADTTPAPAIVTARNFIVQSLLTSCLNQTQADTLIRQALDQAPLNNWTIETNGPFTSTRPCASPGFDETMRIVYIIPIPPRSP